MTRRRWIPDEIEGNRAALTGAHADHLTRVLRARVGDEFDIATGASVRSAKISAILDHRVEFALGEPHSPSAMPEVTLLLAVFKFDRMEWAIEKATELGVARLIPVIARRTDRHLALAAPKRADRWRRLVLQAAEQSRRTSPPAVEDPLKLSEAIRLGAFTNVVLAESERCTLLKDALTGAAGHVALAVGPEGGWTPEEEVLLSDAGWIRASLGPSILRAETAAIAALAVAFSELS